jgi:hypothetical protein
VKFPCLRVLVPYNHCGPENEFQVDMASTALPFSTEHVIRINTCFASEHNKENDDLYYWVTRLSTPALEIVNPSFGRLHSHPSKYGPPERSPLVALNDQLNDSHVMEKNEERDPSFVRVDEPEENVQPNICTMQFSIAAKRAGTILDNECRLIHIIEQQTGAAIQVWFKKIGGVTELMVEVQGIKEECDEAVNELKLALAL